MIYCIFCQIYFFAFLYNSIIYSILKSNIFYMNILFLSFLFVLWTLFWSFASVVIHRLKSEEWWIMWWRSHCPKCDKKLKAIDLIPIFSYLSTFWKCRYCKKKISIIYPILEITTWLLFLLVWNNIIDLNMLINWSLIEVYKIIFFLSLAFISILIIFYDILFLEVHEWILLVWIILATTTSILQTIFYWFDILPIWNSLISIQDKSSSIFLIIFIILALYQIMLKWMSEIVDSVILAVCILLIYLLSNFTAYNIFDIPVISSTIWALAIFIFFFLQIVISSWKWLWWWDLRIAILLWIILWISYSFAWLMITYISWSIIWLAIILFQRLKHKKKIMTVIPFWPFLMIWLWSCLLWQKEIWKFINIYL